VLNIDEAGIIENGVRGTTQDASKSGYGKGIEPVKSVVRAVVEEMRVRDQLVLSSERLARHRDQSDVLMDDVVYPAHGMVVFDDVNTAIAMYKHTNKLFKENPDEYPRDKGWWVEVVHTDGEDSTGGRRGAKPLSNKHPWLLARHNNYQVDDHCARLLFVVGIGREGVNNPACGPIGVACSPTSLVEWVQRAIGRQLRAVTSIRDGKLRVPPAPLDSVRIITHKAFKNEEAIRQAIDFVCDMESHLAELPTISELDDLDPQLRKIQDRDFLLTRAEKIAIAGHLGEPGRDGELPSVECVIGGFIGDDDGSASARAKKERARDWANKVLKDPAAARSELRLRETQLRPRLIVTREHVKNDPTDADLERYLTIHQPHLVEGYVPIQDNHRAIVTALHQEHARRFYLPPLDSDDNVDVLRKSIAQKVIDHLGRYYDGGDQRERPIYGFVGAAVKQTLGTTESVNIKSNWDTPQVHAMLRRSDVQSDIVGWVTDRLIDKGFCPSLATFLRGSGGW